MAIVASDGMGTFSEQSIDNRVERGCVCDWHLLSRTVYYNKSEATFPWKKGKTWLTIKI